MAEEAPESRLNTEVPLPRPTSLVDRFRNLIRRHPRRTAAAVAVIVVMAVIGLTDLRYPVFGTVIKAQAQLTVVDPETDQPISEATVKIGNASGQTDQNGKVTLTGVAPGNQTVEISKTAYQTATQEQKLEFGANDLGVISLRITGIRLSFNVYDKVSQKPLEGASIEIGASKAVTNAKGVAVTSVEADGKSKTTVTTTKDKYLKAETEVALKRGQKPIAINLVPEGKVYYLTNRSRRIDLMRSNLDGSKEEVIVRGTGNETEETGILPNIGNPGLVALLAGRSGETGSYGERRNDLYIVNGNTKAITKIDTDIDFYNVRAWVGNHLVYEVNRSNSRLIKSYNSSTAKSIVLDSVKGDYSYLYLTLAVSDAVYYSVDDSVKDREGLFRVSPDGTNRKRLSDVPADQAYRLVKEALTYEYTHEDGGRVWKRLNLVNDQVVTIPKGPGTRDNRGYADSPGRKYTTFVEERDGRSELYLANFDGSNERRLTNNAKAGQFVQWYGDDYIVFSVTEGESALYIVSVDGGKPVKITDFYRGNGATYGGGYNPNY